jgi:hypothetical protein
VFHARDFHWSEVLDYLGANLALASTVMISGVAVLKIGSWKALFIVAAPYCVLLGLFLFSFLFGDAKGMYSVNMAICATTGAVALLGLLGWAIANRTRSYTWKVIIFIVGLFGAGSLEVVFDFPPFFDVMDAHAIWHGITPFLGHLFYSFWKDHLAFEEARVSKHTKQASV